MDIRMEKGHSAKFYLRHEIDENGNYIRRWIPADSPSFRPAESVYGGYVETDKEHIQEAKDSLLKNMFDMLTELSKKESFWFVREQDDNRVVVGWSIEIIPMSERQ